MQLSKKPRIWLDTLAGQRGWICYAQEERPDGVAYQVGGGMTPRAAYLNWARNGQRFIKTEDRTDWPCN